MAKVCFLDHIMPIWLGGAFLSGSADGARQYPRYERSARWHLAYHLPNEFDMLETESMQRSIELLGTKVAPAVKAALAKSLIQG